MFKSLSANFKKTSKEKTPERYLILYEKDNKKQNAKIWSGTI